MRRLFGTDGIRGVAGEAPLDPGTIYCAGLALAQSLAKSRPAPRVLLGEDTRESSPWIARLLAAGLAAAGAEVVSAGVLTTPGVAFLARKHRFAAAAMVSASHNPWRDNGIKVFGGDGYKLPDAEELEIESEIFRHMATVTAPEQYGLPRLAARSELRREYEEFLRQAAPELDLAGMKVVIDCANGAAGAIAQELFAGLGGEVCFTHIAPNGRNINENCGALHPEIVAAETKAMAADLGVTLDGDADRALFADAQGKVVDGDAVLLLAARHMQSKGELRGNLVVATSMSNMGLEAALRSSGIRMMRAPVGDKYVLEMMRKHDAQLGGEQSGHILFPRLSTTGDGLLTALVVLDLVARAGRPLHAMLSGLKVFPQAIVNVRVREKRPFDQLAGVVSAIREAESELEGGGRVVVRYSGTEQLARVMIEAESEERMRRHADRIARAIQEAIGA